MSNKISFFVFSVLRGVQQLPFSSCKANFTGWETLHDYVRYSLSILAHKSYLHNIIKTWLFFPIDFIVIPIQFSHKQLCPAAPLEWLHTRWETLGYRVDRKCLLGPTQDNSFIDEAETIRGHTITRLFVVLNFRAVSRFTLIQVCIEFE